MPKYVYRRNIYNSTSYRSFASLALDPRKAFFSNRKISWSKLYNPSVVNLCLTYLTISYVHSKNLLLA